MKRLVLISFSLSAMLGCQGGVVLEVPGEEADAGFAPGDSAPNVAVDVDGGVGISSGPAPVACADAGATAGDGWIVFDSDRDNLVRHIFAISADGCELAQLTSGDFNEQEATVSLDGSTLLFTSDRDGTAEIYSVPLGSNGLPLATGLRKLTTVGGAGQAVFSPGGTQIAFHSGYSVYLMNADGTNLHNVIPGQGYGENYEHPVFTAAGDGLVVDRENEIDAFDLNGQNERSIIQNWTTEEYDPAVSRNGLSVAYAVDCGPGWEIDVSALSELVNPCTRAGVTAPTGTLLHPSWGPGTVFAFAEISSAGLGQIAVADAANQNSSVLTPDTSDQENPFWALSTYTLH